MKLIPFDYRIQTERLYLRSPLEENIDFSFDASRYPGFNDGMLWDPPATRDDGIGQFEKSVASWEKGAEYIFTLVRKEDDELIGMLGVHEEQGRVNIGFWTHPKHQSYGYMTEALGGVLKLVFKELELKAVEACHADWNIASRRVLEKNGFRFKRHLEEGFLKGGEWVPEDVFGLTRSQWEAGEKASQF